MPRQSRSTLFSGLSTDPLTGMQAWLWDTTTLLPVVSVLMTQPLDSQKTDQAPLGGNSSPKCGAWEQPGTAGEEAA